MAKQIFHGSDLEQIEKVFGVKAGDIISFAANVNPVGVPEGFIRYLSEHLDSVERYPDREYSVLRQAISAYTGTDIDNIMVGSGATELISNAIKAVDPRNVLMIEPTYSEYARKLSESHTNIDRYLLPIDRDFDIDMEDFIGRATSGYDMIMICNPNNPTGTALTADRIAAVCDNTEGVLLVDETYVEFADTDVYSCANTIKDHPNLIVLRGTSKFFATPGLRLGYLMCSDANIRKQIAEVSDPWSVNVFAAESGKALFMDLEHISRTKVFVRDEMKRVISLLREMPFHIYEPVANFVLMRIEAFGLTGADIFEHCIRDRMMIRDCSSFAGLGEDHIRICLNTVENNDRLIASLRTCFENSVL